MFNKKGLIWLYRLIFILPIVPIIWNIIYINKYSGFESSLRFTLSFVLVFAYLTVLMFGLYSVKKESKVGTLVLGLISCVGMAIGTYSGYVNTRVYQALTNMTMSESVINYSLVTMANDSFNEVSDLEGYKIGTLNLTKQEVVDNINQFLKDNKLEEEATIEKYDSPVSLIHDLYDGYVDAIIVGDNYASLFSEQLGFENIQTDTKVLATIETVIKNQETVQGVTNTSLIDEPFSVLLIGVDSTEQGLEAASLADSLIIATVNPQNLSVTMTSIPRDSYVDIPCFNNTKDKITHSNNGGTTCVLESVEKMFDLNIPYYVKINFKGVVELVDAIGGIDVDVPVTIEEQNSDRQFGENIVTVEEGYQHLNGEQALALSRHRKTLALGDLARAGHQQLVIEGIVNKMLTEMDTVGEFLDLLDVLGNNIETNITLNQITSGIQFLLGLVPTFNSQNPLDYIYIKSMVVSAQYGYLDNPYYDFKLSYAFPYEGAIADAREQMLINLGQKIPQYPSHFTFNGFEEYEGKQWVKLYYDEIMPYGATENSTSSVENNNEIEKVTTPIQEENEPTINKIPNNVQKPSSNESSNNGTGSSSTSGSDNSSGSDSTPGSDNSSGSGSTSGSDNSSGSDSASGSDNSSGSGSTSGSDNSSGSDSASGSDNSSGSGSTSGSDNSSGSDSAS
ncbi:MAG: LCP family protein, partial [Turicibacter sp.]|nr:LCP family protein [Turicibacter sp.]